MAVTENVKKFFEAIEKDDALKAQIEALANRDDIVEQITAIAKEHGYTLTAEDFNALTEEDFKEGGSAALSLDDLDSAAGGCIVICGVSWKICNDIRSQSQMHRQQQKGSLWSAVPSE